MKFFDRKFQPKKVEKEEKMESFISF